MLAILCLLFSGFAPAVIFMVFYVLATVINYPNVEESKRRVDAHAQSAMMMCSVLFAATFLLVGLSGVDLGEHQKKTIPLAFALTILMLIVAVLTGGVSL